jgi:hypothetical protein
LTSRTCKRRATALVSTRRAGAVNTAYFGPGLAAVASDESFAQKRCRRGSLWRRRGQRWGPPQDCGNPEHHDYELYLAVEDIDHTRTKTKTKTKSPQTNGICERFHRTVLDEFYRVAFRKKIYRTIDELQRDLDAWVKEYNETRPHQGRWCYGKTPLQTFLDALPIAREKLLPAA